eukprot:Hpha_TRINITY_DN13448_c0_g1::TRINITY_DN13448_c0_g1_i2::g.131166::m.131166
MKKTSTPRYLSLPPEIPSQLPHPSPCVPLLPSPSPPLPPPIEAGGGGGGWAEFGVVLIPFLHYPPPPPSPSDVCSAPTPLSPLSGFIKRGAVYSTPYPVP